MMYKRATALFFVFILCFSAVIARLFSLSIWQGESISITAQRQQHYLFTLGEKRGTVYDRAGLPMTYTGRHYAALIQPSLLEDQKNSAKALAYQAGWTTERMEEKIKSGRPFSFQAQFYGRDEPGISFFETFHRENDTMACHLIGSVNEKENKGRSGLEAALDGVLSRKTELYASAAVDGKGREITGQGVSIFSQDYYGKNGVQLTVDSRIQRILEQGAAQYLPKGAAVVSEVATGALLGVCSRPGYDADYMGRYLKSTEGELLNRGMQCYNLGSVFKIVVAAAAKESGTVLEEKVYCDGRVLISGRSFGCHKEAGHGWMDMEAGFAQSCNPYFIKQGLQTGLNPILEMAERFGLREPLSLCPGYGTKKPVLPKKYKGEKPSTAFVANTSIGQGDILLSPLHALQIVNVVANGGLLAPLHVLEGTLESGVLLPAETAEAARILEVETAAYLQKLMAVTMEAGTGTGGRPEGLSGGGKTGSAETGQKIEGEDVTHGWFAGYFPKEKPRYSIVVFAENGKSGAAACAPYFKYIADEMVKSGFLD